MLLTIPTVVVLSMCIGVGGCIWPNSVRAILITLASLAFRNKAPNSASAAEDATNFRTVQSEWMGPLSLMGVLYFGRDPKKKCLPAHFRAFGEVKYEASECTFNTMSEA